jgi:molecular chaperone GrpE (heat shock protein)
MNPNNEMENTEDFMNKISAADAASVDDFIKQLEAKERDLHISSEMVIEIDEADFDDTNPNFTISRKPPQIPKPDNAAELHNSMPPANSYNSNSLNTVDGEKIKLREQVSKLEADCAQLTESLRRRQTDFDNFKNRVERERSETYTNQIGNLAAQMLPVLDNLNRALEFAEQHDESGSEDFHQFFQGIVLVNQQLNEVLAEMGISPVVSVGEAFDPHLHEAVATEETDAYPPNTVTNEFLRGYQIGNRLIRAAMVKVAVPPKKDAEKLFSDDDLTVVDKLFEAD